MPIFSDYFFLSLWKVHWPPPLDTPSPTAAAHSLSHSPTLRAGAPGCYTSAPMPGFLEGTGRAETMRGPEGLNVYGWVALAPPLTRRSFGSLQPAGPRGEGRCPCWVPAPRRSRLPGPPPCVLPTGGWMGLLEAGSALQGLPSHPLGSQVLLPPVPVGWIPFPGPQETEAEMNIY